MQKYEKYFMQAIELLRFCDKILKSMSEVGLRISDYRHVQMYDEYVEMVREGHKKEYVRTILAEKYGTSESSIKRVIRRLSRWVKSRVRGYGSHGAGRWRQHHERARHVP